MLRKIATILLIFSILNGCAGMQMGQAGTETNKGSNVGYCALMGAGMGAGIGAATRIKKPLKNALIGALVGAFSGAILCDIIEKNAREASLQAAKENKPVEYRTQQGQRIVAVPAGYVNTSDGYCQNIENEAWDSDGTYLGKVTRKVCRDKNNNLDIKM